MFRVSTIILVSGCAGDRQRVVKDSSTYFVDLTTAAIPPPNMLVAALHRIVPERRADACRSSSHLRYAVPRHFSFDVVDTVDLAVTVDPMTTTLSRRE